MANAEKQGLYFRFKLLSLPARIASWSGLVLLIYTVLGFLAVPLVAKLVLEKKLPPLLHRPVSIGKITLNPYSLRMVVENFHVGQKEGPGDLVAFDRLQINLETASLFKRALLIKALSLSGPRVEFSHLGEQTYSFSDLLKSEEKKPEPTEKTKPFQFAIRNIEVKGGRISFHDLPKKTDHTVTDLNVGIPSLSNLPYQVETYIQPSFSAVINGTPFAVGGQSKPFAKSHETVVELKAKGINVPEYLAYIPNPTGLVLQSALLDVDANLHLLARPDNTYRLAVIGRVGLREVAITDKAGQTYLQLPELAVTLADSNLLAKDVHLTEVSFSSPVLNLERLADGRLLPVALLTPADKEPEATAVEAPAEAGEAGQEKGSSLKVNIDKVLLTDGRVDFLDATAGATVSTRLEIDTDLHYLAEPDSPAQLAILGRVALRDLALADQGGKNYLKVPELALTLAEANLLAQEVHFSEINLQSPSVTFERLVDGRILPVALLLPTDKPQAKGGGKKAAPAEKSGKAGGKPFKFSIDRVGLTKGRVDFLDSAVGATDKEKKTPAHLTLSDLAIQLEALSNTPESLAKVTLATTLNEAGTLKASGQLGLEPLQSRLNLQLLNLALKPFQPYLSEQANLVIAGGKLTVSGALALTPKKGGGLKNEFQGEAALANLATVDTILGEELVKWRNLEVKKIHYSSDPGQLSIAAINLVDPYINVLLGQGGTMNLTSIRPEKPETVTPPAQEAPPPPEAAQSQPFATAIGSIKVSGGRLDFIDRQVDPAYGTSLSELSGSISDLSSMAESSAEVAFAAKLDQQAPMKITGRINPLREDLFVDLKVDFADINMSPISPYSGKFIGYKIDKGKLNLDLKYDIAGRRLSSQNKVFLDQFTLGETVESPDAANLPVRLALALLRDRKGGINLDLPVEGSLDDPEFRIGRVVIQVLINLISKAATSPFALLGALIPEGQDIQFIGFETGRAELIPESAAKLVTLEKILFERPDLRMDLIGKVDPAADSGALTEQHLSNRIKAQKLLAGGKDDKEVESQVAGVELSAEEYPKFLALAYKAALKAEKSRKPPEGKPTVASMETFLREGIKVSEDELRLLALERANKVLATLVAGGQVEPGRLFVVEPTVAATGEPGAASQVEVVIK